MLIKVEHNGKTVTRETTRKDVTHVMVCLISHRTAKPFYKIMGLHKSEAKAHADVRKCQRDCPWLSDFGVYSI